MAKLPKKVEYDVNLVWDMESGGDVYVKRFPKLKLDMPVEFGGKGRSPCPDEYFLSAVGGCYLTTFLYFKERLGLRPRGLKITVQATANYIVPKGYRITETRVFMHVTVDAEEKEKAEECIELAREHCHLAHSIKQGLPIKVLHDVKIHD